MAIFLTKESKVLVQGMTGGEGMKHTRRMLAAGTDVVGGVNPRKAGQTVDFDDRAVPVFGSVRRGHRGHRRRCQRRLRAARLRQGGRRSRPPTPASASPSSSPKASPSTTRSPSTAYARANGHPVVGPNCPGLITPGQSNAGIIPADIAKPGRIGLVSKSGTLTYQLMYELRDIGFSTCVGIGGDPVVGTTHIDCLAAFQDDPDTELIVLIGEIGGDAEERAAAYVRDHVTKPVVGYIAGFTAPEGKTMGHAGAIVSGSSGTAPGQEGGPGSGRRTRRRHPDRDGPAGPRPPRTVSLRPSADGPHVCRGRRHLSVTVRAACAAAAREPPARPTPAPLPSGDHPHAHPTLTARATPHPPSPSSPAPSWTDAWQRCLTAAPEAFRDDRVLNLWGAAWQADGRALPATSPVDGSPIAGPPRLDALTAQQAVRASLDQHRAWRHVPLAERRARVAATLDALTEHRELLALLLVWEIGKPWRLAQADVDRAIDGVRWYVDGIEPMVDRPRPRSTGPVSNIASWNYPMSVLVHAMLVQALAGNAVIAKTPTDGGVACLTLACALAAREGIPVTLVSGSGGELSEALVRAPEIGCVSFVGGRDTGAAVATAVADLGKRHILEQEGLNTWGIWNHTRLGRADRGRPQALRLRQAALHRLPALRRPARAVRRLPGGVPPRRPHPPGRPPAGRRAPRRPAARSWTSAR